MVLEKLIRAGYERFNFGVNEDLEAWESRQAELFGVKANDHCEHDDPRVDGVPGPSTAKVLARKGRRHGLWVVRAGD